MEAYTGQVEVREQTKPLSPWNPSVIAFSGDLGFRRPRLLDFVASLAGDEVEGASRRALEALPDLEKAVKELTVLKGVGPATASAVLAAYAPDVAPFMSDEVRFSGVKRRVICHVCSCKIAVCALLSDEFDLFGRR